MRLKCQTIIAADAMKRGYHIVNPACPYLERLLVVPGREGGIHYARWRRFELACICSSGQGSRLTAGDVSPSGRQFPGRRLWLR